MEGLDVLPVLLQQGHEEVHGQVDVLSQFLLGHLNVSNGNVQAENLLHLELDGGLQVEHLCLDVISVGDERGELARLSRNSDYNLIGSDSGQEFQIHEVFGQLDSRAFYPTLLSPGPSSLGICLIRVSEQRKAS